MIAERALLAALLLGGTPDAGKAPPSPEAVAMSGQATNPALPAADRVRSLRALVADAGPAVIPAAGLCLADAAPEVRTAAAEVLATVGGAKVRPLLENRLGAETDPDVRDALEHALAKSEP